MDSWFGRRRVLWRWAVALALFAAAWALAAGGLVAVALNNRPAHLPVVFVALLGTAGVAAFHDTRVAARIGLTTVAQPRDELAKLGIATIADRIERKLKGPPRTTLVGVSLVTRQSTGPPPQGL